MPHDDQRRAFEEAFTENARVTGHEEAFCNAVIAEIHSDATHEDFKAATCRLNRNSRILHPPMIGTGRMLLYFAALASAIWLFAPLPQSLLFTRVFATGDMLESVLESPSADEPVDASIRLLLYGDESAVDNAARWHALWMSEPDNPVWFSRYAAMRLSDEGELDPELVAEAARIDPENGFWHLVAACVDVDEFVEKVTIPKTEDQPRKIEWHAMDEDEVLRLINQINQAAAMPILQSRQRDWYQTALPHLPPTDGFLQQIQTITLLAGEILYGSMHIRKLPNLQEAAMRIALDRNDSELAATIIRDWHRLSLSIAEDSTSLVEILIAQVIASHPVEFLYQAAQSLGLEEEVNLIAPILNSVNELNRHREAYKAQSVHKETNDQFMEKASILGGLCVINSTPWLLDSVPPIEPLSWTPSRRMEFAFFERMLIALIAMVTTVSLVIFGACWLWAGRVNRVFARRAVMMVPIWKLAVFGLLAGAGPLLWYLLITRHTPLGWHEWSLTHGMRTLFVQWGVLAFLILLLPGLLAAIVFEKKGKVFGWRWPFGHKARAVASIGILATLPASGMILLKSDQPGFHLEIFWWGSLVVIAVVAIATLWSWFCQWREPLVKSTRRLAAGLLAAHARLLTLALLSGWAFLTQFEEKSWAARDTLFVVNPDSPALSSNEEEIQRRLRAQVLDMLGPAWTE